MPISYTPTVLNAAITYTAQFLSLKPVNRIIGISFCRQTASGLEESTIGVFPGQFPYGVMFEGDIVNIAFNLDMGVLAGYGITHIRLYRTISGLDSGEQVANELDTDWHLIDTLVATATITYHDGGAVTTDPMDLYLAKHFYPPRINAAHFGLTEGGWFYAAGANGDIHFSERYMHHAWPTENRLSIPEEITDSVANDDNVYVGTKTRPYIAAVATGEGEQGTQAAARAFSERLPCLPGTMVAAPSGAIYASPTGLVALSKSGPKVITAGIVNAGDILYKESFAATENLPAYKVSYGIQDTKYAQYWEGKYFGFFNHTPPTDAVPSYIIDTTTIEFFENYEYLRNPTLGTSGPGGMITAFATVAVGTVAAVLFGGVDGGPDNCVEYRFNVTGYPNYLYLFSAETGVSDPLADWPGTPVNMISLFQLIHPDNIFDNDLLGVGQINEYNPAGNYFVSSGLSRNGEYMQYTPGGNPYAGQRYRFRIFNSMKSEEAGIEVTVELLIDDILIGRERATHRFMTDRFSKTMFGFDHWQEQNLVENLMGFAPLEYKPHTYNTSGLPRTVPSLATTTFSFVVEDSFTVGAIKIDMGLVHAWNKDITFTITSPLGTIKVQNSTMSDETVLITAFSFEGENAAGTWTVGLYDNDAFDDGLMNSMTLTVCEKYEG